MPLGNGKLGIDVSADATRNEIDRTFLWPRSQIV
jgi:hypothetical protein